MTVSFRPRTAEDDERSIRREKSVPREENGHTIPMPTDTPIVSWNRPCDTKNNKFLDEDDDILKCVTWPLRTNILCHHCCYSFEGVPVPLPQSYDALRKVYHCRGNFCSWQCAKAYNNLQTPPSGRGNRNMYISLLAHRTWVKYRKTRGSTEENLAMRTYAMSLIHPSPPREVLKVFGGKLSIDQFREGLFGIIPPSEAVEGKPFLTIREKLLLPFLDSSKKRSEESNVGTSRSSRPVTQKIEASNVHRYSNDFCAKLNKAKSDQSIMKRKREVTTAKNTLMSTMGVVMEIKKR